MLDIQIISGILLFAAASVLWARLWRLAPDGSRSEVAWVLAFMFTGLVLMAGSRMGQAEANWLRLFLGVYFLYAVWASFSWPRRWRREAVARPAQATATSVGPAAASAAWYPDPGHRHEWRYFDGATWTAHVADAGWVRVDPMPRWQDSSAATPDDPADSITPGSGGG